MCFMVQAVIKLYHQDVLLPAAEEQDPPSVPPCQFSDPVRYYEQHPNM